MYLLERPLGTEEQLFLRDHYREVGQVVAFVTALDLAAAAGSYLLFRYVLGPIVGHASYAVDRLIDNHHRHITRRRTPCA